MNIGIDARLWNETGVGRYIRSLVENIGKLDKKNRYTIFLTSEIFKTINFPENFQKIETNLRWHTLNEQLYLPGVYKKANLDLIHIPYFSVPILIPIPFIVTIHDLTISYFATGKATTKPFPIYLLKRLGYRLILSSAVNRAKAVITVSETVKKQLIQKFGIDSAKITVTYESGALDDFHYIKSSNKQIIPKKYLLYVGNAHPHKNLQILLEAFNLIKKNFPDLKLVLIGKNDFFYQKLYLFARNKDLLQSIVIPGEVTNQELSIWYQKALCFVFPSLSEGFGLPGLEAMSQKCPVAASNIAVFHEIYGEAAYYFNQHEPESIAETIIKIINESPLRQKLINLGNHKAQEYSWQQMASETLKVYENCVSL